MDVFRPGQACITVSADAAAAAWSLDVVELTASGVNVSGLCTQLLKNRSCVTCAHVETVKGVSAPGSPRSVLKHLPSFYSSKALMSSSSESDGEESTGTDRPATPPLTDTNFLTASHEADTEERFLSLLSAFAVQPLPDGSMLSFDSFATSMVKLRGLEDNFYVLDLGIVTRLFKAWFEAMPRVHPFYAVKCNTDKAVLATLAALGAGFDCASDPEVEVVMSLGVPTSRIILANACKRPSDIKAAARRGVNLTTFDTESELLKLTKWHPESEAVLRIRADDPDARCQLGNKYGAEIDTWLPLLQTARQLGVNVVGVSFHVGSGATNPNAFSVAIQLARKAFDLGLQMGFDMRLLDLGGGFCGGKFNANGMVDLGGVPAAVNAALDTYFPEEMGVQVIAEPGRYFAEACATLYCQVFGCRKLDRNGERIVDYYITDGLYGSMNCLLYDHATLAARPLFHDCDPSATLVPCTIFGPTCDGLDTVLRDYPLPELENGDWLAFPRMGAYTIAGASKFNGINAVDVHTFYVYSQK